MHMYRIVIMLVSYFADKGVVTVDDNHGADEVVVKLR
jgi:hypothetical protein